MNVVDPRDVITGFFRDVQEGRASQAFARLDSNIIYHVVAPEPYGGALNLAGLAKTATAVFDRLASPLQLEIKTLVVEGDRVVAEVSGHAPTKLGGIYDNDYLFLYRIVDGFVVEAKEYLDSAKYIALIDGRL